MVDSLLRGMGIGGAIVSVGKNAIMRIINEMEKKQPKLEKVGYEITKLSPPISAKLSRCLLYTSPSPRDGLLSRMPSSA